MFFFSSFMEGRAKVNLQLSVLLRTCGLWRYNVQSPLLNLAKVQESELWWRSDGLKAYHLSEMLQGRTKCTEISAFTSNYSEGKLCSSHLENRLSVIFYSRPTLPGFFFYVLPQQLVQFNNSTLSAWLWMCTCVCVCACLRVSVMFQIISSSD